VEPEADLRHLAHLDPLAELAADEAGGAVQAFEGRLLLLLRAEHADEHLGVAQVARDLGVRDGHEADAGVLHLAADDVTDLAPQQLLDPFLAHAGHHTNSICTSATSTSGLLSTVANTFCKTWSTNDWSLLTQANARVARRHVSRSSTSAAETLNRSRVRS